MNDGDESEAWHNKRVEELNSPKRSAARAAVVNVISTFIASTPGPFYAVSEFVTLLAYVASAFTKKAWDQMMEKARIKEGECSCIACQDVEKAMELLAELRRDKLAGRINKHNPPENPS